MSSLAKRISIGNTINLSLLLYLSNAPAWWGWIVRRPRKLKPPLQSNLLLGTYTYQILQQLVGNVLDYESSYLQVFEHRQKISRLQWRTGLTALAVVFGYYVFLVIFGLMAAIALVSTSINFAWATIPISILIILLFFLGSKIILSCIGEMQFSEIDLINSPLKKPQDALKCSQKLIRHSNLWQIEIVSGGIVSTIFGTFLALLGLVLGFVPALSRGWGLIIPLLVLVGLGVLLSYYRFTLLACSYYLLRCQREGLDLQLPRESEASMHFCKKVVLSTPESVELEFTLAGIGNRTLALLIDYGILFIALLGLLLIWLGVYGQLEDREGLRQWLNALMSFLFFVVFVGYFVFFETLWQGQTPGKRYANIRVIQENGRPIGLSQATLRALLRPFDDPLSIGFLLIIFSGREKRLGDLVAHTIVIQEHKRVLPVELVLSDRVESVSDFLLAETAITQLTPDDFAVIKAYLQRRKALDSQARPEVALRLATQVKDFLGLTEIPEGIYPELFLEGIYRAYQKYGENPPRPGEERP